MGNKRGEASAMEVLKARDSETYGKLEKMRAGADTAEKYEEYRREYKRSYYRNYKRHFELVQEIAKTGDVGGAYAKLFPYVKDPIKSLGSRMKQYPDLALMLGKLLDAQGLSLIMANGKLGELLEAKKPVVVGKEVEMYPDNAAQTENLKTLYRLHKVLGEGQQVNITQNKVEFNCGAEEIEKLGEIVKKIEALERGVDFSKHKIEVQEASDAEYKG